MQLLKSVAWCVLCTTLVGCNGMVWQATASRTDLQSALLPTGKLIVEGTNGSIVVKAVEDANEVQISAQLQAKGSDLAEATKQLDQMKLVVEESNGDLIVRVERPSGWAGSVSYEIQLPPGISVVARTSNASVSIENTGERVEVETSNGPVSVTGAGEAVDVKTSNGPINVVGAAAVELNLDSSNGPLAFTGELIGENNVMDTSNASVQAILTGGSVAVSFKTSNGAAVVNGERLGKQGEARIGEAEGSGSTLVIKTSNAAVTIDQAPPSSN